MSSSEQQIADWLEKLGMSEYAQRFADNDIDLTILSDLTDQDLEKIGVASLGHRRKASRSQAWPVSLPWRFSSAFNSFCLASYVCI
jgi:hypothetical protein